MKVKKDKRVFWLVLPCIYMLVGYPLIVEYLPEPYFGTDNTLKHIIGVTLGILLVLVGGIWRKSYHNHAVGRGLLGFFTLYLSVWVLFYIIKSL